MGNTCIVIDDDNYITEVFSEMLELMGLNIVGIGHSGTDAIRIFTEKSPDIVFMDVHMPNTDGIEALRKIKEASPKSKVVMVTGDLSTNLEKILERAGANAVVFKPFDIKKIISVLEEIQTAANMVTQR